jgi:hypothetical protein
VEFYDVETVDQIAAKMEADGGRFSTLLNAVIESAPFQRRRETPAGVPTAAEAKSASAAADQSNVKH